MEQDKNFTIRLRAEIDRRMTATGLWNYILKATKHFDDFKEQENAFMDSLDTITLAMLQGTKNPTPSQPPVNGEGQYQGSVFAQVSEGVTIGCISPEARDLLDTIMAAWEPHYEELKKNAPHVETTFYGFAYWLVRWSGLVQPANPQPSPAKADPGLSDAVTKAKDFIATLDEGDDKDLAHHAFLMGYAATPAKAEQEGRDYKKLYEEANGFIIDLAKEFGQAGLGYDELTWGIEEFIEAAKAKFKEPEGLKWRTGANGFPVQKSVIAKKYIPYLQKEVIGAANSKTGEMISFDWHGGTIAWRNGHEELADLVWLDESGAVKEAEPAVDPVAFDTAMEAEINKLPYTKHLDDGQYNDGQLAGFEAGANWAKSYLQQTKQS